MDGVAQLAVESAQGFWKLFHFRNLFEISKLGLESTSNFSACDEASFFFLGNGLCRTVARSLHEHKQSKHSKTCQN